MTRIKEEENRHGNGRIRTGLEKEREKRKEKDLRRTSYRKKGRKIRNERRKSRIKEGEIAYDQVF